MIVSLFQIEQRVPPCVRNAQGNAALLIDAATGDLDLGWRYNAFGAREQLTASVLGAPTDQPFTSGGMQRDPETGMLLAGNGNYYNVNLGRDIASSPGGYDSWLPGDVPGNTGGGGHGLAFVSGPDLPTIPIPPGGPGGPGAPGGPGDDNPGGPQNLANDCGTLTLVTAPDMPLRSPLGPGYVNEGVTHPFESRGGKGKKGKGWLDYDAEKIEKVKEMLEKIAELIKKGQSWKHIYDDLIRYMTDEMGLTFTQAIDLLRRLINELPLPGFVITYLDLILQAPGAVEEVFKDRSRCDAAYEALGSV